MRKRRGKEYTIVIERDEEGWLIADAPQLPGCHTQARSLDALMKRMHEAISLYLETNGSAGRKTQLVGVQRIAV